MLLEVKNLTKHFPISHGFFGKTVGHVHAVSDVSFTLEKGKTLGVVGESGCGKTTLGRLIMRLMDPTHGEVLFEDENLTQLSESELRHKRRHFQMVFQDPYSSLNPRMRVGELLAEPLIVQGMGSRQERKAWVMQMLSKVGFGEASYDKYPHEFSGGQRQRIGIARAIMLKPKLIIADEPVSALDVSIQAQIINLLKSLQQEFELTYLFVAHDIKVVRHMSDEILVMYLGRVVERLPAADLFNCKHPYTQALIAAIPDVIRMRGGKSELLTGDVPSPINLPAGCVFNGRCAYATDRCRQESPALDQLAPSHQVACHYTKEIPNFKI